VTDIFREVEEEVRRERAAKLWKQYGDYIIAGVALIIIAVAGFQLWRVYEKRQVAQASVTYAIAQQMLDQGQAGAAAITFSKLAETAPSGYSQLSLLNKANPLYASGNVGEAVEIYKQVVAKNDPLLAPVARMRQAWATVDTASRSDLVTLLQPLTSTSGSWRPVANEVLAYADFREGQTSAALAEFRAIVKDPNSPPGLKDRCNAMATYLASGGAANFGTVPPVPPSPQNAPDQGQKPQ